MADAKKIFIAEDNHHYCELYRMALAAEGYEVHFAHNGKDALEKISAAKPDLIILDVMMPEIDGYEVCRKLRELAEFALTPIIMLTALTADEDKIKGYDVGADDYITKPFSLRVLKARVANILERSDLRMQATQRTQAIEPAVQKAEAVETTVQKVEAIEPVIVKEPARASVEQPTAAARAVRPGEDALEQLFGAALPLGANILILGALGSGKSFLSRLFLAQGLRAGERCTLVCIDDNPAVVRQQLTSQQGLDVSVHERQGQLRFVDAYSWSAGKKPRGEKYAITGPLDLADLSALISEAGAEPEQAGQPKSTGRRVVDSISSLFLNFELSYVQRFIAFLARSGHFAGISTLFVVEEGTCREEALNNVKYIMDGVLELKKVDEKFLGRPQNMKWGRVRHEWLDLALS